MSERQTDNWIQENVPGGLNGKLLLLLLLLLLLYEIFSLLNNKITCCCYCFFSYKIKIREFNYKTS